MANFFFKIAEKKGISSIQRNIRLYYNCRDWVWYQFYTMMKGEMAILKKKLAEEERRKQMAEGLAKFQAILAKAAEEREAAAAAKAQIEFLGASAGTDAAEIVKGEEAAAAALAAYDDRVAWVNNQRTALKADLAKTKATLTKGRDDVKAELAAAKDAITVAAAGYDKLKNKAVTLTAETTAMKGNVAVIADAIAALDKKAAAALVEKRELWSTISTIQSDITTALARGTYLEKEGFEVDGDHMGSLVKMHYKLHSYVTYKIKKGKK